MTDIEINYKDERLGLPSASSFYADVLCPGRQNLIHSLSASWTEGAGESDQSEFALRGTRIHKALETDQTFELAPDELAAYNNAFALKLEVVFQWQQSTGDLNPAVEMGREARFWLHNPHTLAPMLSGQLDAHWITADKRHMLAIDYKSGWAKQVTSASLNWQLRCQALLAWIEYDRKPERIRAALVKPEAFGDGIDQCDFTVFDLQQIEAATYRHLWSSQQPDAPLHAGEHCRYCPARAECPAALSLALTPIRALQIAPEANGKITKKIAAQLVQAAPIEAVREVFGKRTAVKYVMEAVGARLKALPEGEKYRLKLKMNLGRSTDYIRDTKAAYDAMAEAGFSEDDIWKCLSLSKTEVIELFQRMTNARDSAAEAWYENQFDEFIERGRGDDILAEA